MSGQSKLENTHSSGGRAEGGGGAFVNRAGGVRFFWTFFRFRFFVKNPPGSFPSGEIVMIHRLFLCLVGGGGAWHGVHEVAL